MSIRDLLLEATMTPAEAQSVLELPARWSASDLKSAFRKAARANHPDRGGDHKKMKMVNAAYKVLQRSGPRAGAGSRADARAQRKAEAARSAKIVQGTINGLFDPEKYAKYFHKQTGKLFTFTVYDKATDNYVSKQVEWTSSDRETVFALDISVSLTAIKTVRSLGGHGGDPTLAFTVYLAPTVLHDNRKSKMRKKNWDFSTKEESLVDPKKVFPVSSIKRMMKGSDKKRKFSKRDMVTAMERRLKADIHYSGKDLWSYVPVGPWHLVLVRGTMMGTAYWDLHSVRSIERPKVDGKLGKRETVRPKKGVYAPEIEGLIEVLKQVQGHKWNNAQALADTVANQMRAMAKAAS